MYLQSIEIKGAKYKIYQEDIGPGIDGLCYKDKKKIIISSRLKNSEFVGVLAHEIAHGLIHEIFLDQNLDDTQEEMICEMVNYLVSNFLDFCTEIQLMVDEIENKLT